ncbi:MAG: hypothetical protein JXR95_00455 [Deltaproteobacteria bacterium]|nr:hypothetical protein [Deltaproteobacteria bacterium]
MMKFKWSIIFFVLIVTACSSKKKSVENDAGTVEVKSKNFQSRSALIAEFSPDLDLCINELESLSSVIHKVSDSGLASFTRRCALVMQKADNLKKKLNKVTVKNVKNSDTDLLSRLATNLYDQTELLREFGQNREWAPDKTRLNNFVKLRKNYRKLSDSYLVLKQSANRK